MTPADEARAAALARRQCARDQAHAVAGGCDVFLVETSYLPWARKVIASARQRAQKDPAP